MKHKIYIEDSLLHIDDHVVAGGVVSTEYSIQFLILILILNQKK